MAIFPIKKKPEKKPEKKPKVQDSDKFLHQIDIELIVGTYLNSNDITMTDENHKKLLEDALSYFYETLDDYDMRGSEDYMPTPNEYRFLFRDAKEADVLEDDIIGFVENYNVEDNEDTSDNAKIQDEELTVDELWYVLVDGDYFTEAELELLTDINGYSIETLNDAIHARYGYHDYDQLAEDRLQDSKINIPDLLKKEIEALGDKSRKADLDKAIATIKANEAYPMVYDVYIDSLIEREKDKLLEALVKNKDLTVFNYGGMLKVLTKEDELKLMEDQ